jgi:hypothetical protein
MRASLLAVTSAFAVVVACRVASADEKSDAARAAALFEEGRRLMAAEDYAAASRKLAESQALSPAPDTAFDLGLCYEKASQAAFKAAHDLGRPAEPASDSKATYARAPGPETEQASPGQTQRLVGWTIGGAGVAGIVAGAVTAFLVRRAYDKATDECGPGGVSACSPNVALRSAQQDYNSAAALATASTVSFLAGAAVAGVGAVVLLTAPSSKPGVGATVGLAPTTGGAGLSVAGWF